MDAKEKIFWILFNFGPVIVLLWVGFIVGYQYGTGSSDLVHNEKIYKLESRLHFFTEENRALNEQLKKIYEQK